MKLNITILFGSYREPSLGRRILAFVEEQAKALGHNVTVVDAQKLGLPVIEKRYVDYAPGTAPKDLEDLKVLYEKNTDAFIVVAGEYNGTIQPGLKNLIDHFYIEYFHKPSGVVMYSVSYMGGARAAGDVRELCGVVGMPAIPSLLSFPEAHDMFDGTGHPVKPGVVEKTRAFIEELAFYGRALKREKELTGKEPGGK